MKIKKAKKPLSEWQKVLTEEVFDITRGEGTEPPFNNAYWDNKEKGIYVCSNCELILFDSEHKYETGTGWPSFWRPFNQEHIEFYTDKSNKTVRTGARCARCEAHLGHVFDDGPAPTGKRYCMNSAAFIFEKED